MTRRPTTIRSLIILLGGLFLVGALTPLQAEENKAPKKKPDPRKGPEGFQELAIGDSAPNFSLLGIDDKLHSLSEYTEGKALVVVFTCNHCPSAQAVEERLKAFVSKYTPLGVVTVAISPNHPDALRPEEVGYSLVSDGFEDMKIHAANNGFNFPYLYDGDTQEVAKAYGCRATPHVFVFDADEKLRYSGYFDDSRFADASTVTDPAVAKAVDSILSGQEVVVTQTRPHGCSTKWKMKTDQVREHLAEIKATPVETESIDAEGIAKLRANGSPRYRLFNLWATWCAPCVEEMPALVDTAQKFGLREFEFLPISLDKAADKDKVDALLSKMGAAPPKRLVSKLRPEGRDTTAFLYGDEHWKELAKALDPEWAEQLPHTILVAPDGEIVFRQAGAIDATSLHKEILKHMGRYFTPAKK